jgi:hypothetical protein
MRNGVIAQKLQALDQTLADFEKFRDEVIRYVRDH